MATKTLDTIILDGMYMDIHSIEFEYTKKQLREKVEQVRKLLEENQDFNSINIWNTLFLNPVAYYNSTSDDEERTEDCDSRIDTELLNITKYGVYYRGYSKWTSDYLEIDLSELL